VLFGREPFCNTGKQLQMFDADGDGKADLVISAPNADGPRPSNRTDSGEVLIVFAP